MFTNPARAGVLGAHVLGSFHPVYAENKISLDNACFPKGSHCCYVKLGQINPLVIEEMIKGERAMQKFAGLMKGLASKGAKTASSVLLPKSLGLADPLSNKESMVMLTQPEMVSKQMQLGGHISNKPPEKEGHWKKEYDHKCPGYSAVRFEPYDEVFWFAPSIYAPGSPWLDLRQHPFCKSTMAQAMQCHLHMMAGNNSSCRLIFFSEQEVSIRGWAYLVHNFMLDVCDFCKDGADLKVMLGSVDDIHGNIFEVCYKFLENARAKMPDFPLWSEDNPVEWLVKNRAYLLQGPFSTPEQRDAFLRRDIMVTDSVLYQRVPEQSCSSYATDKGAPVNNAQCLVNYEISHYQTLQWGVDKGQKGLHGLLGESLHLMPPSETDEDGVAIESSKVKMASYYPYMGGCARHLHERIVALMHRLSLEPHQFTGLLHVHLNGNDMEESSGKQGGGAKQGRWPCNSKEIAELAAYLKLFPKGTIIIVGFGSEKCWRKNWGGAFDAMAKQAKELMAESGHPVLDPSVKYEKVSVSGNHFQNGWEDRRVFAEAMCSIRRIAKFLGVLRAGEQQMKTVLGFAKEQQSAPWAQAANMPPKRAGEKVRAVLKPHEKAPTPQEIRVMDYLTGQNPLANELVGEPDEEMDPDTEGATLTGRQREKRDQFFEEIWEAQSRLPAADEDATRYGARIVPAADNLEMTWTQFCIYQYVFAGEEIQVSDLVAAWLDLSRHGMEGDRIANVTSYPDVTDWESSLDLRETIEAAGELLDDYFAYQAGKHAEIAENYERTMAAEAEAYEEETPQAGGWGSRYPGQEPVAPGPKRKRRFNKAKKDSQHVLAYLIDDKKPLLPPKQAGEEEADSSLMPPQRAGTKEESSSSNMPPQRVGEGEEIPGRYRKKEQSSSSASSKGPAPPAYPPGEPILQDSDPKETVVEVEQAVVRGQALVLPQIDMTAVVSRETAALDQSGGPDL